MRRAVIIAIACIIWLFSSGTMEAMDMLEDIEWSAMDESIEDSGLPYSDFKEYIMAVLKGDADLSFIDLLKSTLKGITSELKSSLQYLCQLAALLLISVFLKTADAGPVAIYAVMLTMIWTAVQSFQIPYEILKVLIERVQSLGQAEIPILAAITIAAGRFTTATLQGEILLSSFSLLLQLVRILILPSIQILFLLNTVGALTNDEWTAGISTLLHTLVSKGMKVLTSVLLLLLSIRIQVTGISDQWLRKAASAVASSVPVIGNSLSGALDTVTSSAGILVKTVGIAGVILLMVICLMPVCKLVILWLLYTTLSLLLKPFLTGGSGRLLKGLAESVSLMLGLMTCVMLAYAGLTLIFALSLNSG